MQAYSLALDIISGCWLVFVAVWVLAAVIDQARGVS